MDIGLQVHTQNTQQFIHDELVRNSIEQHNVFMRRTHPVVTSYSEEFKTKFDTYQAEIEEKRKAIKAKIAKMNS